MNKLKRVLFTIPNFDTAGSQQVLLHIASSLNTEQFEAHICCTHNRGTFFTQVQASQLPIHIKQFFTPHFFSLATPRIILGFAFFLKRQKIDLVHSFQWSSDISEVLATRLAGAKWIYTKKNQSWGNKSWRIKSYLANGIVTINSQMHKTFFPNKKEVACIPCSVDRKLYTPTSPCGLLQEKLGLNKSHNVIVTVANVYAVKGVDIVVEAIHRLNDDAFRLIIVGSDTNDFASELKSKYASDKRIHFVGKQANVKDYLSIAQLFVLPSRSEALGVALLEALSMGILCIGSRVPGIEFVFESTPEFLFTSMDIDALMDRLLWAFKLSPDKKESYRQLFFKKIAEQFDPDSEVLEHEKFYTSTLEK